MRGYECHLHHMKADGTLVKNDNTACWAGIQNVLGRNDYFKQQLKPEEKEYIFVERFVEKETEQYIDLLIRVLNKITPCEKVVIKDKEYIKIKLLHSYDSSLIVLNFLRNLWSCPTIFNGYRKNGYEHYIPTFFETLRTSRLYRDPLKRLTFANKEACSKGEMGSMGHSNIHNGATLLVKDTASLLAFNGYNTQAFLTRP